MFQDGVSQVDQDKGRQGEEDEHDRIGDAESGRDLIKGGEQRGEADDDRHLYRVGYFWEGSDAPRSLTAFGL